MLSKFIFQFKQLFFLRRNFFLVALFIGLSLYSLSHYAQLPGDSARVQIIIALISLTISGLVLLFALFTASWPLLTFWFRKRVLETDDLARENLIRIGFEQINNSEENLYATEVRLSGIRRPWLGFVKARLYFENDFPFLDLLFNRRYREKGDRGILARRLVQFPHTDDYRVKSAVLYFEDFFHLFSFPFREQKHLGTFTVPKSPEGEALDLSTETTEEPVLKVMHQTLSKGELFDYKKYAPGDDVRRIIWQNYARNRELTVRIPDRNYPYVSHINVIASFYDGSNTTDPLPAKQYLLDIYKEKIRQVIDALTKQGYAIRFFLDQDTIKHYQLDESEFQLYQISAASWQKKREPASFLTDVKPFLKDGSNLMIVSSLAPAPQLSKILENKSLLMNLAYYEMSLSLAAAPSPSLIKQLFFINSREALDEAAHQNKARPMLKYLKSNDPAIRMVANNHETGLISL